jgi:hypothetical protein
MPLRRPALASFAGFRLPPLSINAHIAPASDTAHRTSVHLDLPGRLSAPGSWTLTGPWRAGLLLMTRPTRPDILPALLAEWQSGHAAACKAVYLGSIPGSASTPHPASAP